MTSASASPSESSFMGLLARFAGGDRDAQNKLISLVYPELRRIATAQMRRERPGHTLQPTALVNEAFLRLVDQPLTSWNSRAHFLALAARLMRRILVDHARRHRTAKRGGTARQITLTEPLASAENPVIDVLLVHDLLQQLGALDYRQAEIVELHFFGGMSFEEIALVLNITARTVKRDWSMARAWLHSHLSEHS